MINAIKCSAMFLFKVICIRFTKQIITCFKSEYSSADGGHFLMQNHFYNISKINLSLTL